MSDDLLTILRAARRTDRLPDLTGRPIVIFGAGNLGRRLMSGLKAVGLGIEAFADNDRSLWGSSLEAVSVMPPGEAAAKFGKEGVFIVAIWRSGGTPPMRERRRQLEELGCETVVTFAEVFTAFPGEFLPHFLFDRPERLTADQEAIEHAFGLFKEGSSRREFLAQLRLRLRLDFDALGGAVEEEIYFPDGLFELRANEVFVDGGAYTGDTLRRYLHRGGSVFERAWAFEPDPRNFAILEQWVKSLPATIKERITIRSAALGERAGVVRFNATGDDQARAGTGEQVVEVIALDEVQWPRLPTYLKLDIEGFEPAALKGAQRLIQQGRPVLAISAYHSGSHLWDLPNLVDSLVSGYAYYLRPHRMEGWDLVCYAVPAERSVAP